jgi:hypothetical protein
LRNAAVAVLYDSYFTIGKTVAAGSVAMRSEAIRSKATGAIVGGLG